MQRHTQTCMHTHRQPCRTNPYIPVSQQTVFVKCFLLSQQGHVHYLIQSSQEPSEVKQHGVVPYFADGKWRLLEWRGVCQVPC